MGIDPSSAVPLFQQIASHIRGAVAAGIHRPGEAVPSVRLLAMELTVNPNTVQRAYEALEREGVIEARKGRGMFVTSDGVASARNRSQVAVREAFDHGIRAGISARMSADNIRGTFNEALNRWQSLPRSEE